MPRLNVQKTLRELATMLAKSEGKKHQASIGDIRELIGLISDEIYKNETKRGAKTGHLIMSLYTNGGRRAAKAKK